MTTGTETEQETQLHGGRLVAKRLKAHGVSKLFTLSGGHLFSIYDGCREEGVDIVDVRHEQSAAFAAEGWAKATREPGVAALTAGPGVTNGMSGMASALQNGSPMVVLGGRAPAFRWGQGSLQEIDHIPFVAPVTKLARTAQTTAEIPGPARRGAAARRPRRPTGPAFVDFPLDQVFMESDARRRRPGLAARSADGAGRGRRRARPRGRAAALGRASRWSWPAPASTGRAASRRSCGSARSCRCPVFLNGLARGCVPADHPMFFSRARGAGLKGADLALVVGVPMDFRLGFGGSFGEDTADAWCSARLRRSARTRARSRPSSTAAWPRRSTPCARAPPAGRSAAAGSAELREVENEKRAGEQADLNDDRAPLHPLRVYHELNQVLDRDAIVIGDGGDFVSFAGPRDRDLRAGLLDGPGPVRLPRIGPRLRARREGRASRTARSACCSATAPSASPGMEFDSFVRHGLPIVGVMGNNGIWALEKHPMEFLYGYSVAAELQPQLPLRRGRPRARRARRAGRASGRAEARARARVRVRQAGAGQRPDRPRGRLPAQGQPGLALCIRRSPLRPFQPVPKGL